MLSGARAQNPWSAQQSGEGSAGGGQGVWSCSLGEAPPSLSELHVAGSLGLPGCPNGKEPICQGRRCKRHQFNPWVGKIPWRRNWRPTPVFLLENSMDRGAWRATVHRVSKSQIQLSAHTHTHTRMHIHHSLKVKTIKIIAKYPGKNRKTTEWRVGFLLPLTTYHTLSRGHVAIRWSVTSSPRL